MTPQKINIINSIPNWLVASILYGISWSGLFGINLSFIAWFAFVPLFIDLEKINTFRVFYLRSLLFSVVSYFIICHGFLITPKKQLLVALGAADELLMSSVSFALLYPFKKRLGFKRALVLFPFIIALWEWLYQKLEHTFGYLMLSHSQSENTILIQYLDIFGVWSIAFWVMMFNVLLYFLYKKYEENLYSRKFALGLSKVFAIMLIPPLCYYALRYSQIEKEYLDEINITLIKTNFGLNKKKDEIYYEKSVREIERLTFLTDSIDYELKKGGMESDLYVWHEGAVDFGNLKIFTEFIDSAVSDWKTPLLAGMQIVPDTSDKKDLRPVNRAKLFTVNSSGKNQEQYYDKVHLMPGHETIPYLNFIEKLSFLSFKPEEVQPFRKGDKIKLIELTKDDGTKVKIGTPICLEQNYSYIWSDMALESAGCFVQLSYESWWSLPYFLKQMNNIAKLRCIETRRTLARCSNGGFTGFIDEFGNLNSKTNSKEGTVTANVRLFADVTFFSAHQNFFPVLCVLMIFSIIGWWKLQIYLFKVISVKGNPFNEFPGKILTENSIQKK